MKKIVKLALVAALVCCAFFFISPGGLKNAAEPAASAAPEVAPTPVETAAPSPTPTPYTPANATSEDRQAALASAKRENADTVAWLYIPAVEVDDPVLQAQDNGYYLQRGADGEYDAWGCYYADCRDSFDGRGGLCTNTVIYGHSASDCDPDGPRFTKLHRYLDPAFVQDNPYIYLSVDGEDMLFQIAACFITNISFDYINPEPLRDVSPTFFDTVAQKNQLAIDGVSLGDGDKLLTLSTCCRSYDPSGNQRLVIMAKLIDESAPAQPFTVRLAENPTIG